MLGARGSAAPHLIRVRRLSHTGLESRLNPSHTCLPSLLRWEGCSECGVGFGSSAPQLWGSFLVSHPGECHLCEPAPAEPWHGRIYLVGDVSEEKTALGVTSQGHIPFFHLPPCPTATVAAPAALPEQELLEKLKKTPKIKGAGGGCDGMSSSPLSPFLEEC